MMKTIIDTFLNTDTLGRLRLVKAGRHASEFERYFGQSAYGEYLALANALDVDHLDFGMPPNVIFVPGIMGSLLKSETRGGIWWIDLRTRNFIDQLQLSNDGVGDAVPQNQIVPVSVDTCYDPFLTALLAESGLVHKIFAYDWRKSPDHSADQFFNLVTELYEGNGRKPVQQHGWISRSSSTG
jgi:hypothetical protein